MIQVFKPFMGEEEIDAVAEVLKSGWIGLGPKTAGLEKGFAEYIGVEYAVGVNSATSALDLALKLLQINHGDEVIVPTITFVSTAHVVAYNLGTPIFADVDPTTLSIDIEDVKRKISLRTRAIIPVHYGGRPVDMDRLKDVSGNIPIIEDAAHACGGVYKGRKCGSLGDIGCFSFHAVKNLAMGDGGALTINDGAMAERAKRLRWLGIDKGTWDRSEIDKSYWWEYFVDEIGLKCHMNDIMAAIGLVQLSKLEMMNSRRKEIAKIYSEAFRDVEWIEIPPDDNDEYKSSWHIYHIKVDRRDELSIYLQENGIATGVHYKPIHLYSCYGNRPVLPVAEKTFLRILSLPMYPGMSNEDVEKVIDTVTSFKGRKI
jgi:perosamine synthetase